MLWKARQALEEIGIKISDKVFETVADMNDLGSRLTPDGAAYDLVVFEGAGEFDEETGVWSANSSVIYAFEIEIADVDRMYTQYFQGLNTIIPGAPFTAIEEDLSEMTDEMSYVNDPALLPTNGKRSVAFLCNGTAYRITLDSLGDWFNVEMLGFTNEVLKKEGFPGKLHILCKGYDLMVILLYNAKEKVSALQDMIKGTELDL